MDITLQIKRPETIAFSYSQDELLKGNIEGINRLYNTVQDSVMDFSEQVIVTQDFLVIDTNVSNKESIDFLIQNHQQVIKMVFSLSATIMYSLNDNQKSIVVQPNQHNIFTYDATSSNGQWSIGTNQRYIQIILSKSWLEKYIPFNQYFENFLTAVTKKEVAALHGFNMLLTPQMAMIIHDLLETKKLGILDRLYTSSKVLELIMLQLEQYMDMYGKGLCSSLRKTDIDRMLEARDIVVTNLENPCTLIDLAHQVGTNEYQLKKNFKEVFGTTVFGYLNEVRMKKAKEMLLSGEHTINEIAFATGYNDATNFTVAFKRFYGITPSSIMIKKNKKN